jgi:peptidoglycan pentaglycine glycine transferase (the second and third glycine)
MKIITLKKEEFDNFSSNHKYNSYYQSSNYADFATQNDGYNVHYLGFVDENDKLIGASLMLYKTLFWGYKFAYAPRGLLINYENDEIVKTVTIELKKLLKKQKFIFITIDPLIVASERDRNGKIIQFNNSVNRTLTTFKQNNYDHLGFNLYNESKLPRWNVIAKLNNDGRTIYNNFDTTVKEKISYGNSIGIVVEEDPSNDINLFYEFVKPSYKSSKKYFNNLFNAFNPSGKIKIFYAKLSTKKYVENVNKLYAQEEEKNIGLANIIQSGDAVKYNIAKAINDKLESDKLLHAYKKDIVVSTKLLKTNPDGILCGGALVLEDAHGVNILVNYVDNSYNKYNSDTLLIYEIMKYYGKLGFKYINIGAVTGNFDSNSKYYPMLENKLGFNSSILEYIGEFNMVINPTMYTIYKKKYNK